MECVKNAEITSRQFMNILGGFMIRNLKKEDHKKNNQGKISLSKYNAITCIGKCSLTYVLMVVMTLISVVMISGCDVNQQNEKNDKITVVTTIFPQYDFFRQIAGDKINLSMLIKPGNDIHSYEPSPQDIKKINGADMLVYVGGDSDAWIDEIMDSVDMDDKVQIGLMDCVSTVEEESKKGMTIKEEGGEEEKEYDEHVWTSPQNAILIVRKLCAALSELDPDNASYYKQNSKEYIKKLEKLDEEFKEVVKQSKRKEIIVGDRFPFRYLTEEYGLDYYAAFPGCSDSTEANAETIAFLIDKVKEDDIPVVFHTEMSNEQVCDAICEQTGAKSEQLNAVHNISDDDFKAGVTYIDLMEHNVEVLKEALN